MDIIGSISVLPRCPGVPALPHFTRDPCSTAPLPGSSLSHTSCGVLALPHLGSLAFPYLTLGPRSNTPHPESPAQLGSLLSNTSSNPIPKSLYRCHDKDDPYDADLDKGDHDKDDGCYTVQRAPQGRFLTVLKTNNHKTS